MPWATSEFKFGVGVIKVYTVSICDNHSLKRSTLAFKNFSNGKWV